MNKRILAKNFLIYASGAALLRSLSFITAPITMFYVSPEHYGMLALMHSTVMVLALLCGMGLRQVLLMEYFTCNESQAKQLVNDLMVLYVICAVPILLAVFYFVPTILDHFQIQQTYAVYGLVVLMLLLAFFTFFIEFFNQVMQYEQQARLLSIVQVIVATCAAGLQIFFLCWCHWGITSIFLAQWLAFVSTTMLAVYGYYKFGYGAEFSLFRALRKSPGYLKIGISFMPSMIANWLMIAGNRFVIAYCGSLHDVGIYAVTDTLGQLFNLLVVTSLSNAYIPLLMRSFSQQGSMPLMIERTNRTIMYSCMAVGFIVITLGCTVAKPFLRLIMPPAYYAALDYLFFLLVGYLFYMGATFASGFVQWQKHVYFLSGSVMVTAALQVCLSMVLVPRFAIYGSVIACLWSYAAYFLIMLWFNNRLQQKVARQRGFVYKER